MSARPATGFADGPAGMTATRAKAIVAELAQKRVLVIGDVMLDEYLCGDVNRMAPDAPVPVVELKNRAFCGGGAANVAVNIAGLGGVPSLVGVVGMDGPGSILRRLLSDHDVETDGLVVSDTRPTTHKLRVLASARPIVRVDLESREPLPPELEATMLRRVLAVAAKADAVIVSDYAKGVITESIARAAISHGRRRGIPVVVDPKGRDLSRYAGATVVTPNVTELEAATGLRTYNRRSTVAKAGACALPGLGGAALLVTCAMHGMILLRPCAGPLHVAAATRAACDVTGAGDTVVAALALALAAKMSIADALVLATHAAAIAVETRGTAAVRGPDLEDSLALRRPVVAAQPLDPRG